MLLKELSSLLKIFFLLLIFVSTFYLFFNEIRFFVIVNGKIGLTVEYALLVVSWCVLDIHKYMFSLPFFVTLTKVSYFFSGNYNIVCMHLFLVIKDACVIISNEGVRCLLKYCLLLDNIVSFKEDVLRVSCQKLGYLERCARNDVVLLEYVNNIVQNKLTKICVLIVFSYISIYLLVFFFNLYLGLCRSFLLLHGFYYETLLYVYLYLIIIVLYWCW